jgi:molybdopterin converting factor small subunit
MFFAQLREFAGCDDAHIEISDPIDADHLWKILEERFPGMAKFRSSTRLARNFCHARDDQTFSNDDEVALLSPVSGG